MVQMRYFALAGAVLSMVLAGVGCRSDGASEKTAAAPQLGEIDHAAAAEVVQIGRESGDRLLKALQTGDFGMTKDLPVGNAQDPLTQARFDEVVSKVIKVNGGIASFEYLSDLNVAPYRLLIWKVNFKNKPSVSSVESQPEPGNDMLFELWMGKLDGQYRIVGFRFKI